MSQPELDELQLSPDKRQIIFHVCEVMAERLGLDEAPVRGFFWTALKEWQQDRELPTAAMGDMTPQERIEAAKQIGVFFTAMLRKYLPDSRRRMIDDAWTEALRTYVVAYGLREAGTPARRPKEA
jgi:hypothetical protein